jgi:O-antigen ligase
MILALVIAAVIGAVVWFSVVPARWKVRVLAVAATFQVFFPVHIPNVAVFVAILVGIEFGLRRLPALAIVMYGLAVVTLASGLWSVQLSGIFTNTLYFAVAGALIAAGQYLFEKRTVDLLSDIVGPWVMSGVVVAMLVIVFRAYPQLELEFFHTSLAHIVINPSVVDGLFAGAPNNAIADDKSGAFFVNANVASVYLGVVMLLAMFAVEMRRGRVFMLAALIAGVGVVCTGSKTGLGILTVVGFITVLRLTWRTMAMLPTIVVAPVVVWFAGVQLSEEFGGAQVSTESRVFLWTHALQAIKERPLLGLGYGGWEQSMASMFSSVGSAVNYPPHNLILAYWIYSGVFTPILLVVAILLSSKYITAGGVRPYYVGAAFWWTVAHSMGDNTSYLVDWHVLPVLAVLIGCLRASADTLGNFEVRPIEGSVIAGRPANTVAA